MVGGNLGAVYFGFFSRGKRDWVFFIDAKVLADWLSSIFRSTYNAAPNAIKIPLRLVNIISACFRLGIVC